MQLIILHKKGKTSRNKNKERNQRIASWLYYYLKEKVAGSAISPTRLIEHLCPYTCQDSVQKPDINQSRRKNKKPTSS